jgi:hypothetical protein
MSNNFINQISNSNQSDRRQYGETKRELEALYRNQLIGQDSNEVPKYINSANTRIYNYSGEQ